MSALGEKAVQTETIRFADVAERLRNFPSFADLHGLAESDPVALVRVPAGEAVVQPGQKPVYYFVVLSGRVRADRPEQDGTVTPVNHVGPGEGYGETPLMHGKGAASFFITAEEDTEAVRFSEEQFWNIVACCPPVRKIIIRDMTLRMQAYQVEALHREKLVTLGTMAAGLMHELHNPGAAAKRSAAQLRGNLLKLQELALRISDHPKTPEQLACMRDLLQHTVQSCRIAAMSSLEQSDAEEAMGEWLQTAGVENAFAIAPTLVAMGFEMEELECAKTYFDRPALSNALNWLGALVSSMSQVCAIEESIGRVSELVTAVKKFAYDEKSPAHELDVHDSLQSTLTILGHKLRIKQIKVEKKFDANPAMIETRGSALGQVWTNLIDNAADASPANAAIEITTWNESDCLAISILDHGSGIPEDVQPHIFEPFFTTKPQGTGTGLGLDIVHRIVTQKFGGSISLESRPGSTRFVIRLPRKLPVKGSAHVCSKF
jgi:signal transduction histidine kinase